MGSPRSTVIVVSHNSAADLPACLDSLRATITPDDELLVYDGGSTDDSAAVATGRGARVERSPINHGFAGAANRAASLARGRILVFLNPDTVVEPGWLEALLAPLAVAPGLTTAQIRLLDAPERIDTIGNSVHLSGITVCRGYGRAVETFRGVSPTLAVSGAAFAIDRGSFERLGGFDERFFMYLEDTDLSLRAALAGLPCYTVAESRVRHRHVPAFGPRKLFWLERNRWLMLFKIWSPGTLLTLLPSFLLVEALVWAFALARGRRALAAKAGAWLWLARRPWALAERRRSAQRLRRVPDAVLLAGCAWRIDLTELLGDGPAARLADAVSLVPFWLAALPARLSIAAQQAATGRLRALAHPEATAR